VPFPAGLHRDDDLPRRMALGEVAHRVGRVGESVGAVDDRGDRARLSEGGQRVLSRPSGRERGTFASRLVRFAITRVTAPSWSSGC
jgi:hypothetical protein